MGTLAAAQAEFRRRFAGRGAITDALNSAVRRNVLYASSSGHRRIREAWADELRERGEHYSVQRDQCYFERDIERLVGVMNSLFASELCHEGFRVSHAQKSLSVYLKHLWCSQQLGDAVPPVCPVDRLLLTYARAPRQLRSWTKTANLDVYRAQLESLKVRAGSTPLAIWELETFNDLTR